MHEDDPGRTGDSLRTDKTGHDAAEVAPTGDQHSIGYGRQEVVVTEVGATLRSYKVGDDSVIEGFPVTDISSSGRGQVLAPWPNRVGDGRYTYEGIEGRVALDEPERRNAIHGLVRWLPWRLVSRAQNVVVLACRLYPQPGYPWMIDLAVEYRLGRAGLAVTTEITNPGMLPAPFGLGFHPYLTVGTPSIDTARLKVPAGRRLVADERGLPTGEAAVEGTELDFRVGHRIGSLRLDTAYFGLERSADGLASVELEDSGAGRRLAVWMDTSFGYVMVFTGDTVHPASSRRTALAIEPMTCPPDALRSGRGLIRIVPGDIWRATWGITPDGLGRSI
ncbi:MAG: aldose 1-epimerase family protein [Acidimicrobiales bacterium]